MLNEDVHCDNANIQGVAMKAREKTEVNVKKEEENVVMAATQGDGQAVCCCCRKPGHLEAFCTTKPLCGKGSDQANVAFVAIGLNSDK